MKYYHVPYHNFPCETHLPQNLKKWNNKLQTSCHSLNPKFKFNFGMIILYYILNPTTYFP